jgi:hypothetical protein
MLHDIVKIKGASWDSCLCCKCYIWYYKKGASWIIVYVNVTWCYKKVWVGMIVCVNVTWYCSKLKVQVGIIVCVNVTWYHEKGASWDNCLCKCYMIL